MLDFNGLPIEVNNSVIYVDVETGYLRRGYVKVILRDKVLIEPRNIAENIIVDPRQMLVQ